MSFIPVENEFVNDVPQNIRGNSDYEYEVKMLDTLNLLIRTMKLEELVADHLINVDEQKQLALHLDDSEQPEDFTQNRKDTLRKRAAIMLRTTLLRAFLCFRPYRLFASDLAKTPLYQTFCKLNRWADITIPSKTTLNDWEKQLPEDLVKTLQTQVLLFASENSGETNKSNNEKQTSKKKL